MILAGLRSLDSVSGSHYYSRLMEKIKAGSSSFVSGRDYILIDLSSWYKDTVTPKIELIQHSIEERKLVTFHYYAPDGDSVRTIEPCYLVFKWSSWYVWGWCRSRKDFRMFKLNRMDALVKEETGFEPREAPVPELSAQKIFPGEVKVKALFSADSKWRLVEEFGIRCFTEEEDGTLLFTADYTDKESLLCWLLTFGAKVKVLEPVDVRDELVRIAKNIINNYGEDGENA